MENTLPKQKHLWLLVGIPGSGKDTFLDDMKIPRYLIVSRDRIRFAFLSNGDKYFDKEKEVFNQYVKNIQYTLDRFGICYANATHLNEKSRLKVLNALNLDNVVIHAIYFDTYYEICVERNELRSGRERVPDTAMANMYQSLTHPKDDEHIKYKSIVEVNNDLCNQ